MIKYHLTRDVTIEECPWLNRNYNKGEILYKYTDYTYGCIGSNGIAVSEEPFKIPFF